MGAQRGETCIIHSTSHNFVDVNGSDLWDPSRYKGQTKKCGLIQYPGDLTTFTTPQTYQMQYQKYYVHGLGSGSGLGWAWALNGPPKKTTQKHTKKTQKKPVLAYHFGILSGTFGGLRAVKRPRFSLPRPISPSRSGATSEPITHQRQIRSTFRRARSIGADRQLVQCCGGPSILPVAVTVPETPALQRKSALLLVLSLLGFPTCAKRAHRHYSGKPALLNRRYRRTNYSYCCI